MVSAWQPDGCLLPRHTAAGIRLEAHLLSLSLERFLLNESQQSDWAKTKKKEVRLWAAGDLGLKTSKLKERLRGCSH